MACRPGFAQGAAGGEDSASVIPSIRRNFPRWPADRIVSRVIYVYSTCAPGGVKMRAEEPQNRRTSRGCEPCLRESGRIILRECNGQAGDPVFLAICLKRRSVRVRRVINVGPRQDDKVSFLQRAHSRAHGQFCEPERCVSIG